MKILRLLTTTAAASLLAGPVLAQAEGPKFTEEELSVAKFWENMGPTLRDEGLEAYAIRYHKNFRHWDIQGTGRVGTYESAIAAWTKIHNDGHRITCTNVIPITIDIVGDQAFARLVYEQTMTFADEREPSTGLWRMFDVFQRYGDTWQVLESNMVKIDPDPDAMDQYRCH